MYENILKISNRKRYNLWKANNSDDTDGHGFLISVNTQNQRNRRALF